MVKFRNGSNNPGNDRRCIHNFSRPIHIIDGVNHIYTLIAILVMVKTLAGVIFVLSSASTAHMDDIRSMQPNTTF